MREFTLANLTQTMRMAAGEDESVDLDGDIIDVAFTQLGYDSLAVMETTSRIERQFGVFLPEEEAMAAETPREFLALVNRVLSAPA